MTDLASKLANRTCPNCGAVQPLYSAPRGGGIALQRGGQVALPCPGCGALLRIEENPGDPGGIKAALVLVTGLCVAIFGGVALGLRLGLGEVGIGLLVAGIVALGSAGAVLWNGFAARRRQVVVVLADALNEKDSDR